MKVKLPKYFIQRGAKNHLHEDDKYYWYENPYGVEKLKTSKDDIDILLEKLNNLKEEGLIKF